MLPTRRTVGLVLSLATTILGLQAPAHSALRRSSPGGAWRVALWSTLESADGSIGEWWEDDDKPAGTATSESPPEEEEADLPTLTEQDLQGSEWKIAIQWEDDQEPQVTWLRCQEDFNVQWGFNAKGVWSLDGSVVTFTREFALGWGGKRIYSAALKTRQNDVYLEGLVRGWSPVRAADFFGQWQAIRLGVDRTPYGEPPWLTRPDDDEAFPEVPQDTMTEGDEPFWSGAATSIKYLMDSGDDANNGAPESPAADGGATAEQPDPPAP